MAHPFSECPKCGMLARHPFCPLCTKKCHWRGNVVNTNTKDEAVEKYAPHRTLYFPQDALRMAFFIPMFVERGKIDGTRARELVERLIKKTYPGVSVDAIFKFEYSKLPYRWDLDSADLTGNVDPFIRVRFGGWGCESHRGALPVDLPAAVIERDGVCVICGAEAALEVVYMNPIKNEDGRTTLANLTVFCEKCKADRGARAYWPYLADKGIPVDDIVIDFDTGFVRSFVTGNKVRL